jgi:streptogrisin C
MWRFSKRLVASGRVNATPDGNAAMGNVLVRGRQQFPVRIAGVLAVAALISMIIPAGTAQGQANSTRLSATVLAAMQRDLGLTPDQATLRIAQATRASEIDEVLRGRLGQDFGGSWFDTASGRLVVGVTDSRRVAEVSAAGANARVVKRSEADLKAIMAKLDALAGRPAPIGGGRRVATGHRSPLLAGLVGWHVDPIADSVIVTAIEGTVPPVLAELAAYGDAVRVEYTPSEPTATTNRLDGGDVINGVCSAGFNLRDQATGVGYLLTAGHCVDNDGQTVSGQGGVAFGPVVEHWFPAYDDALIRNTNPSYWSQGPYGDENPSNGATFRIIAGSTDALIGSYVCKSGITTKLTCGQVRATDETVTANGVTVFGLTRHNACQEGGDSGGPTVGPTAYGNTAKGVNSGGTLNLGRCLSKVGLENRSWYFPIADSLAYYGPRYNVALVTGIGY